VLDPTELMHIREGWVAFPAFSFVVDSKQGALCSLEALKNILLGLRYLATAVHGGWTQSRGGFVVVVVP